MPRSVIVTQRASEGLVAELLAWASSQRELTVVQDPPDVTEVLRDLALASPDGELRIALVGATGAPIRALRDAASIDDLHDLARWFAAGRNGPLCADDIPGHGRPGRIGLTICPGRTDRGRSLAADLDTLRAAGADVLVCLVESHELATLGVPTLGHEVERRGMEFVHLPIRDQGVPTDEQGHALVRQVLAMLDEGKNIVVHCMGGIGRSGTVAACVLVSAGMTPEQAITAVRRARDPRSIETLAQERFVDRWAATL